MPSRKTYVQVNTTAGLESLDLTQVDHVQIVVKPGGDVIWINVDGICRLRICRIRKVKGKAQIDLEFEESLSNVTIVG